MKEIIKSFFYSKEKFNPVFAWTTILMIMLIVTYILDLSSVVTISDMRILGLFGFISSWIAVYNYGKKKK